MRAHAITRVCLRRVLSSTDRLFSGVSGLLRLDLAEQFLQQLLGFVGLCGRCDGFASACATNAEAPRRPRRRRSPRPPSPAASLVRSESATDPSASVPSTGAPVVVRTPGEPASQIDASSASMNPMMPRTRRGQSAVDRDSPEYLAHDSVSVETWAYASNITRNFTSHVRTRGRSMSVLLIGTLDTKGTEFAYVRDRLQAAGVAVTGRGCRGTGSAGVRTGHHARRGVRRGRRERCRSEGQPATAARPWPWPRRAWRSSRPSCTARGSCPACFSLGGSAGTTIGTAAMRALPVGVPKLMVSTLASGQVQPYVGTRDVMMMYSVVDISGLNRISRAVLDNAAAAMIGMVQALRAGSVSDRSSATDKPIVTATMFGVTTPCVEAARKILEAAGYEVLVFHATGTGGPHDGRARSATGSSPACSTSRPPNSRTNSRAASYRPGRIDSPPRRSRRCRRSSRSARSTW